MILFDFMLAQLFLLEIIDVDLEEEHELLGKFWQEFEDDEDLDLVFGVQKKRRGKLFERVSGYLYFKLLNYLSDVKIPENFLTVRLMRRNFLENLLLFKERELVFSIINTLTGFKSKKCFVTKLINSPSTY